MTDTPTPKLRGFQNLTPERRIEISRSGGAAGKGSANKLWHKDRDAMRAAARKGGMKSRPKKQVDD